MELYKRKYISSTGKGLLIMKIRGSYVSRVVKWSFY